MSSQENAPADEAPAEDGPADDVTAADAPAEDTSADDAPEAAAPAKKAAAKKAVAKKAPAKRAPAKKVAKKVASKPVADWLASWAKDAEPEDITELDEPVRAFLATRSDLLPSVRKIVEAAVDLDVRVAAFTLFVDAEAGTELRNPGRALEVAASR